MILYRPVGEKEKKLIEESGYTKYPPGLDRQQIFYPVLNQRYAEEIAGKQNTKDADSGYKGYVTRFEVDDDYISAYDGEVGRTLKELRKEEESICQNTISSVNFSPILILRRPSARGF